MRQELAIECEDNPWFPLRTLDALDSGIHVYGRHDAYGPTEVRKQINRIKRWGERMKNGGKGQK